jgi:hypothetical protein
MQVLFVFDAYHDVIETGCGSDRTAKVGRGALQIQATIWPCGPQQLSGGVELAGFNYFGFGSGNATLAMAVDGTFVDAHGGGDLRQANFLFQHFVYDFPATRF